MDQRRSSPPVRPALGPDPTHQPVAMRRKALQNLPASATNRAAAHARAEQYLMKRVFERCHFFITDYCIHSSAIPAFLAALAANESGGDPKATRFEPSVYRHLKAVAAGQSPAFGGVHAKDLVENGLRRLQLYDAISEASHELSGH